MRLFSGIFKHCVTPRLHGGTHKGNQSTKNLNFSAKLILQLNLECHSSIKIHVQLLDEIKSLNFPAKNGKKACFKTKIEQFEFSRPKHKVKILEILKSTKNLKFPAKLIVQESLNFRAKNRNFFIPESLK